MSAAKKGPAIGFPPSLLGDMPLRLPLIDQADGWIALDKPAGVGVRAYPWDEGVPNLDTALNKQLQAKKPELLALEAELFGSVYYIEPECSGVALFAKTRDALAELRNQCGSGDFEFSFTCVTRSAQSTDVGMEFEVDAPLLPHDWKLKMIPSTAKGKKASTRFSCLAVSGAGWALWQARTNYPRVHQIRAHAAVMGSPLLGDALYAGPDSPLLADVMPKKRGPGVRAPIYAGVALHLAELSLTPSFKVLAPLPNTFSVMLKRLGLEASTSEK